MGVRAGNARTHTHFSNYLYLGLSCYDQGTNWNGV